MEDFSRLIIDIEADDFARSRMMACIYCGNTTEMTRDHVIPVSWSGFKRSYAAGDVVKCCRECNVALSNKPFFCISKRANYLAHHYTRKYRKILNHPVWTDEELEEMSRDFQSTLVCRNNLKSYCMARIAHCTLVSFENSLLVDVKQQTEGDVYHYRILSDLYYGYELEDIAQTHKIELKLLKSIYRSKKLSAIVNAFKYERGISFDAAIYRVFRAHRERLRKKQIKTT